MPATFALLADLHIAAGARADESRRVHAWAVEEIRARRVAATLIAGDFFHARSAPAERNEGADLLLELAQVAPVVGVAGNHDAPGDLAIFNRLRAPHPIRFVEQPAVHVLGDVAVALLPWLRAAPAPELLKLHGVARVEAERGLLRSMLTGLGAELAATGAVLRLLVGHVMLREASVSIGQPEPRGGEFVLGLDDLALVQAHGYALGHVHAGQGWTVGGAPVLYPGSIVRRSYGEREEKSLVLLHVDGPSVFVERIPSPARAMVLAELAWCETAPGAWGWSTLLDDVLDDAGGADVRLRYVVPEAHREAAARAAADAEARLRTAGAAHVKAEEQVETVARARAPEIATTSSLRGKVGIALAAKGCATGTAQHERVLRLFDGIAPVS